MRDLVRGLIDGLRERGACEFRAEIAVPLPARLFVSMMKLDQTRYREFAGWVDAITTGGDLTLESGGDQRYQAAKLESGKNITLDSGGSITFEAVKDLHKEDHSKSKSSMAWSSMSGKGRTDETLRQTQMVAAGAIAITAGPNARRVSLRAAAPGSGSESCTAA